MSTTITCLCDNNVKLSTSLKGEHGISFYIENGKENILFDTGQSYYVLSSNAQILEKDLSKAEKIVLSHGHYDHTGGLFGLVGKSGHTIYGHPDIFEQKFKRDCEGNLTPIGMPFTKEDIEKHARFDLSDKSRHMAANIISTGQVPRTEPLEEVPSLFVKESEKGIVHDDILDDQSLIIEGENSAVVILGCNHSGIINTVSYCSQLTKLPITLVAGGTHLVAAGPERMAATIEYLKKRGIKLMGFHCTGDKASETLAAALGPLYERGHVGMVISV